MTPALALLVMVLAVYRVAHMLVAEDGPAYVFVRARGWLYERGDGWVYQGYTCVLCQSFWWSWLFALFVPIIPYPLAALAIGGGALVLHRVLYK